VFFLSQSEGNSLKNLAAELSVMIDMAKESSMIMEMIKFI